MKLPTSPSRSGQQGFTLIEVLTVVSIIAILAVLTISGIQSAQVRAKTSDTQTRIKFLDDCLTRFQKDNGEYPTPANLNASVSLFNQSWTSGGAACLYQAITGDGTDQIMGYKPRNGTTAGASTGELGSSGEEIYVKEMSGSTKTWFKNVSNSWIVLDGFGLPFQYIPRDLRQKENKLHNETYDLWSYGNLKAPSTDDKEKERQWITNWKN